MILTVPVVFRKPELEERQVAWLWGIIAVSSLLLRPLWFELAKFLPRCPFRGITGIPCPACGTGHAALAFFHGDILGGLLANPLAALAGIVFIVGGVLAPLWIGLGGKVISVPVPLPRWARLAMVLAIAANWIYLITTMQQT